MTEIIALLKSSSKRFEKRIPIHPLHFNLIHPDYRKCLMIEENYAEDYGYSDDAIYKLFKIPSKNRNALIQNADFSMIVRPTESDLALMPYGATALGWFHCVQNKEIRDAAIKQNLTLICMESLQDQDGYFFKENSYITGEQAILYISKKSFFLKKNQIAVIIGYSNAAKGAIRQLFNLGIYDIICCSKRKSNAIFDKIQNVKYVQIQENPDNPRSTIINNKSFSEFVKNADIIINASAQSIYQPLVYLRQEEILGLKKGCLIIDISCDKGMGFDFSCLTYLDKPFKMFADINYCAIDHLPTLDYGNASLHISKKLISLLPSIIDPIKNPTSNLILDNATQIKAGKLLNPEINYFIKYFENY